MAAGLSGLTTAGAATPAVIAAISPASGSPAGGTSVTITGTGLGGATEVAFGDVISPLFRVEGAPGAEQLVAFSPRQTAGASVPVRVRVGADVSADGPVFTYLPGTWARTATPLLSTLRSGHSTTVLDRPECRAATPPTGYPCGTVLVAGGHGANAIEPEQIYDPTGQGGSGAWTPTESADGIDQHAATLLGDGRVLVTGGRMGEAVRDGAAVFDATASGRLNGVAVAGHWAAAPSMASPRWRHSATLLDRPDCHGATPPPSYPCGQVLVVGGVDATRDPVASVELFDPTDDRGRGSWSPAAPLAAPRGGHTATLLGDGTVLVAGGFDDTGRYLASALRYDPVGGRWLGAAAMSVPRAGHSAVVLDRPECHAATPPAGYPCGQVLVAGGNAVASVDQLAELYDPVSPAWRPTGGDALLGPAGHDLVVLAGGGVLAVSHAVSGGLAPAAEYDPAAGAWSRVAGLPERANASAPALAPLADGRALAANVQIERLSAGAYVFDRVAPPAPVIEAVEPAAGPLGGGTRVTVRGRNLFGAPDAGRTGTATSVRFGGAVATEIEFVSDAEVVATSPAHGRGLAPVSVTTPWGTSPPVGAALYTYTDEGAWQPTGPLDACAGSPPEDPGRACAPRASTSTVILDPPACRSDPPPAGYPCGSVLAVGRTRTTVADADITVGSVVVSSATAGFTAADVGMAVVGLRLPGFEQEDIKLLPATEVARVVDEHMIELSAPVQGSAVGTTRSSVTVYLTGMSAERYEPAAGTWRATGPMVHRGTEDTLFQNRIALGSTAALLADGTVLVTGGCCRGPGTLATSTAERYEPRTDSWTDAASLPAPRVGHTATVLDRADCHGGSRPADGYPCGQVLVAGGTEILIDAQQSIATATFLYDPALGTWRAAAPLGSARYLHSATLLPSGDVLVVGGFDSDLPGTLDSTEVYHPVQGTWAPAARAPGPKIFHSATVLDRADCHGAEPPAGYPCGKVLFAGGALGFDESQVAPSLSKDGGVATGSVELYDPAADRWASSTVPATGAPEPLILARAAHGATLLPDGDVLVTGGYVKPPEGSGGIVTAAAEVFEPGTGRWRAVAGMAGRRAGHLAVVLEGQGCDPRCGQVLVAGGRERAFDGVRGQVASAELYTPAPSVAALSPASGPSAGGTTVTLAGAGLGGASDVRFGGVPATIASVSPTTLGVVAPEHQSGPVEVEVLTPAGSTVVRGEVARRTYTYVTSRPPGPVGILEAEAVSTSSIRLRFAAAASDGSLPPPARRYEVKVAAAPITDDAAFVAATALCGGTCVFAPPAVGAPLSLAVNDLEAATTYHFAARALGGAGAGPLSNPASATTEGSPVTTTTAAPPTTTTTVPSPRCGPVPSRGPGQVAYPGGYSLVGLPGGTVLAAGSPLYSWFDQGAGGAYATSSPTSALSGGRGYWAWSACPRLVTMAAGAPGPTTMSLGAYRASMVGNPTSRPVSVSGFDYAARWDARLNDGRGGYHLSGYRQAQTLAPGEGLWVFAYRATTITMQ